MLDIQRHEPLDKPFQRILPLQVPDHVVSNGCIVRHVVRIMTEQGSTIKWLNSNKIQRLFDNNGYLSRYENDDYHIEVVESNTFRASGKDSRSGAKTQTAWLRSKETYEKVALIHRFIRADGTHEASRMPDPKILVHDGQIYCLKAWRGNPFKALKFLSDWVSVSQFVALSRMTLAFA